MATRNEDQKILANRPGSVPFEATLNAKFQHTPALVFFVLANGMVSLHDLLMMAVETCGDTFDYKGMRLAFIAIHDMMMVVLASGADGAVAFMTELGKNSNSHARWNKIWDKFETYCDHRGGASRAGTYYSHVHSEALQAQSP